MYNWLSASNAIIKNMIAKNGQQKCQIIKRKMNEIIKSLTTPDQATFYLLFFWNFILIYKLNIQIQISLIIGNLYSADLITGISGI